MLYTIIVGLIAGWLAGQVMKGGGYGILVDIVLGILGGFLGGWLFGMLHLWPGGGIIGSLIVAFIGAVILVWITRSDQEGLNRPKSRASYTAPGRLRNGSGAVVFLRGKGTCPLYQRASFPQGQEWKETDPKSSLVRILVTLVI